MDRGGGATRATISFSSGDTREVRVAAGSLDAPALTPSSSLYIRAALEELSRADTRADSMAALARLRSGPAAQRAPVAAAIWELLRPLADRGQPVYTQWVPAHCGLSGNERTNVLVREASALPQHETRIDTGTVQKAVATSATATWQRSWPDRWFRSIMGNRLPGPVEEEDRLAAVDIRQLRAGHWSCSERYLHQIVRRPTPGCERCNDVKCPAARCRVCMEEADTPRHVLLRCPALVGRRLRRLGTIDPEATDVRAAGFRAQLSLLGYAP